MNKLSKRLSLVADFITEDNKKIIDIGCDHGLLSIYLKKKYKDIKIIASDINENALNVAIKNIKENNLKDKIETRLGSGLNIVSSDEIDTIIISGMGSNTIVGILKYSKDKLKNVKNIIIQSNTDLYFLRKNITKIGYYIEDESQVEDKNIIYTVIKFTKGKRKYNYKDLYLGPILSIKKDDLFLKEKKKELTSYKKILSIIKKGHFLYKLKIKRKINIIKKIGN